MPQHNHSRRHALASVAAVPALLAAACGASGTGTGTGTTAQPTALPAKKNATIRVTARQAPEADMWPIRVPQFTEKYPNLKLEPDLHAGDIQEKTAALIASNELGDVVHTHFSSAQPQRLFIGKSTLALDAYLAREKVDLKQWYAMAIDAGRLDGKVMALPFKGKMATVSLFYNQSLFEQAGLKPPDLNTSLDGLAEMASKLTKPDGSQWGIVGARFNSTRNLTGVLRRFGAEVFDREQKKATLDTAAARAGWGWYYDAFHRRKFMTVTDAQKLFREGKAAMQIHYDYNDKSNIQKAAETAGFKYSATMIPKGPTGKRGGVWIPDGLQLYSGSKNQDEAFTALVFLADKDTGLALAQQKSPGVSTTPGARPDVYNDPKFLNHDTFPRILQELDRDSNALNENYQGSIPHNFRINDVND
ncbi:MAG TPA: extracellular solute-binding protein, partial [Chloroflexota bacterium]|nr:extracellular solute-binding protein [Chloroflexota bacterium]